MLKDVLDQDQYTHFSCILAALSHSKHATRHSHCKSYMSSIYLVVLIETYGVRTNLFAYKPNLCPHTLSVMGIVLLKKGL